jgi:Sulfotransferase domain
MKVLGIGLGRTGTTSLARALELLGYRAKHCPDLWLDDAGELIISPDDVREFEALTDEPLIPIFRQIDRDYPNSRFILTVRAMGPWLTSIENNGNALTEYRARLPAVRVLHETLYGTATFDREAFAAAHVRHVRDVRDYFAERPGDLLMMDVCAGDGWETLCPFLGKPVPDRPFPRLNVFGVDDAATLVRQGVVAHPGERARDRDLKRE